jgi:malate synthase
LWTAKPMSPASFDFGLFFFHNAARTPKRGSGPVFLSPKLESHLEARLWNDVFNFAQDTLKIPRGTIRATVLIETILATFEAEEILYELRGTFGGIELRALGLHFQLHQKIPQQAQFRFARPRAGDDDHAVHARVLPERHQGFAIAAARTQWAAWRRRFPSRAIQAANEAALASVLADKEREAERRTRWHVGRRIPDSCPSRSRRSTNTCRRPTRFRASATT